MCDTKRDIQDNKRIDVFTRLYNRRVEQNGETKRKQTQAER